MISFSSITTSWSIHSAPAFLRSSWISGQLVRFFDSAIPASIRVQGAWQIAAICHAPWVLIDAGIAESKNLTSWPDIQDDMRAAGAEWVDQEVVIDEKLITSRKPDDIPAFNDALLKAMMISPEMADMGASS